MHQLRRIGMGLCPRTLAIKPTDRQRNHLFVKSERVPVGRHELQRGIAFARNLGRHAGEQVIDHRRSEEHTSELQSLMRISYAVFCLKKKTHELQYDLTVSQQYHKTDRTEE